MDNFNLEDEIEQEQQEEKDSALRRRLELQTVLNTPEGRSVIWRLLGYTDFFGQSYCDDNPNGTAFNEGKRFVGGLIMSDIIDAGPTYWQNMQAENTQRIIESINKGKVSDDE